MEKRTGSRARHGTWDDKAPQANAARWRRPVFEVSPETYIRLQPAARNLLACTIRYFESAPGGGAAADIHHNHLASGKR